MADRYWVGGGSSASWSATGNTNWGTASNTQDNASVPGSGDNAIFDGVGTGASDCTTAAEITVLTIDFTGYANIFTNAQTINIVGNKLKLSSGMTWTNSGAIHFEYVGTTELTTAGKLFTTSSIPLISTTGNTVSMQDAWNNNGRRINVDAGTLLTNGYALTFGEIRVLNGAAINITNSTVTGTAGGGWRADAGATVTATGSTINLTGTSSCAFNSGGGFTYNTVVFSGNTTVSGSNTFSSLTLPKSKTTTFTAGTTTTVTSLVAIGLSGQIVTIISSSAGSAAIISCSSGTILVDYCSIKDSTAEGGASFVATNSTNVSGNSGWVFGTLINVSTFALTTTLQSTTQAYDFSQAITALELALTLSAVTAESSLPVPVTALSLTSLLKTPTETFDFVTTVTAFDLTAALLNPTINIFVPVNDSFNATVLELILEQGNSTYDYFHWIPEDDASSVWSPVSGTSNVWSEVSKNASTWSDAGSTSSSWNRVTENSTNWS